MSPKAGKDLAESKQKERRFRGEDKRTEGNNEEGLWHGDWETDVP